MGSDGPIESFRSAERRLRSLLLGDGSFEPGQLRGEEARARANTLLRQLHAAFDELAARAGPSVGWHHPTARPDPEDDPPPRRRPPRRGRSDP